MSVILPWRWVQQPGELYGRSPVELAIQEYNRMVRRGYGFRLDYERSKWWRLFHPRQARRIRIWLNACEDAIREELRIVNYGVPSGLNGGQK